MRKREAILSDIINLSGDLNDLRDEISAYPWDCETPLITIKSTDLARVLDQFVSNDLLFQKLEEWANTIECREDVDFDPVELRDIVFELANPYIYGIASKSRLVNIIGDIK